MTNKTEKDIKIIKNKTESEISDLANSMVDDFLGSFENILIKSKPLMSDLLKILICYFSGCIIELFQMHKFPLTEEGISALISDIKGCTLRTIKKNNLYSNKNIM